MDPINSIISLVKTSSDSIDTFISRTFKVLEINISLILTILLLFSSLIIFHSEFTWDKISTNRIAWLFRENIWWKTIYSFADHAKCFLKSFFKWSTNTHHLSNWFHARPNLQIKNLTINCQIKNNKMNEQLKCYSFILLKKIS